MIQESTFEERPQRALAWWRELSGKSSDDSPTRPANRGALARLRRAQSSVEILMEPAAIDLIRRLGARWPDDQILVADLAALLAHIREHARERPLPAVLRGADPERPLMSPIRFRRLMLAESGHERQTAFRRALAMADGRIDVQHLARSWLCWDLPDVGDRVRAQWALAYANGIASPATSSAAENPETRASLENT